MPDFYNPVSFDKKPPTVQQNTAYGTFTGTGGTSPWTSPTGAKIGDLPGYLAMKGQQVAGSNIQPYQNKLSQLLQDPSSISKMPAYNFALDQGNQAINRSAAAKGMLNSGNVLAELAKYGQGMASQQYGNQVNMLSGALQNAENFGLQSGYYQQPQNISPYWSGNALISPKTTVSTW